MTAAQGETDGVAARRTGALARGGAAFSSEPTEQRRGNEGGSVVTGREVTGCQGHHMDCVCACVCVIEYIIFFFLHEIKLSHFNTFLSLFIGL